MILHDDFKQDLLERLQGTPDSLFETHGKGKAVILSDESVIEALWARYEKSITEYGVDPDYAFRDALHDVCGIPMDDDKTENAEPRMKLIYVASPLSAPTKEGVEANVAYAKKASRFVIDGGGVPLAPHLRDPTFLDDTDPKERAIGTKLAMELMTRCDEVWLFGPTVSPGMAAELEFATEHGIPYRRLEDF